MAALTNDGATAEIGDSLFFHPALTQQVGDGNVVTGLRRSVRSSGCSLIGRVKLLEATEKQLGQRDGVCWSHPAFANKRIYARNDKELVCTDLSAKPQRGFRRHRPQRSFNPPKDT